MALAIKRKRLVMGLAFAAVALLLGLTLAWPALAARFGTPVIRQAVLYNWQNQKRELSVLQKRVLLSLLYKMLVILML